MTFVVAALVPVVAVLSQPRITAPSVARVEEIACAPMSAPVAPMAGIRIISGSQHGRIMFGPGDSAIIGAGARQGIVKGQRYFVRRQLRDMFTPATPDFEPISIHTAGWVTVVDTKDDMAVVEVTHACDGLLEGDYLEPYTDPDVPVTIDGGTIDYDHPARIVMSDEKSQTGASGSLMLINRGSNDGLVGGQTVTLFRHGLDGSGPVIDVGRGTVLSVRPQTSLIRVDTSHDAVYIGDLAAIHRVQ